MVTKTADVDPAASGEPGPGSEIRPARAVALVTMLLSAIGLVLVLLTASAVDARSMGLIGASGNPSTGGSTCATCHTVGAQPPGVTISGPTLVNAGQSSLFTVEVSAPQAAVAGFNASLTGFAGSVAPAGNDVQALGREITHTSPKSFTDGLATFAFDWTAPTINTQLTMYSAGLAANGNGQNGDDATGTAEFPITVIGGLDEVEVTTSCAGVVGELDILIRNPWGSIADYQIEVDGFDPIDARLLADTSDTITVSNVADGEPEVEVTREDGFVAFNNGVDLLCGQAPDPVAGAEGPIEVAHVVSCLAGNGRVDTNMINTGSAVANYRLEFQGLSPRALDVAVGDWWRMPVTGRSDGDYVVVVKRDGATVSTETVTVSCDTNPPVVDEPEIQVVNACRNGTGYLLLQFANDSAQTKPYVIEFGAAGVPNRSTSAAAYGQSVRAITGRPNGDWEITVTSNNVLVDSFDVTVTC